MFARQRAAVGNHQIRGTIDKFGVFADAAFSEQIETDLHVNAAVAEVPVVGRVVAVFVQKPT